MDDFHRPIVFSAYSCTASQRLQYPPAPDATGDEAYRNYALRRMTLLANSAPAYAKMHQKNIEIDPLMRKVVDPHALDDAGAICSAMIKALSANPNLPYRSCIDHYADYI
ncbi:MAG: hypothetical protein J6N98_05125, partial [Prevotella sp.]|nr:hypothetical protein [Prevotella sp.]